MWSTSFQADFVCFARELDGKLFLKIVADFLLLRGFEEHVAVMQFSVIWVVDDLQVQRTQYQCWATNLGLSRQCGLITYSTSSSDPPKS